MKNVSYVYLFLLLFLFSCKSKDSSNGNKSKNSKQFVSGQTQTAVSSAVNSPLGKVQPVPALKAAVIKVDKPTSLVANINARPIGSSTTVVADKPEIVTPGVAGYSKPTSHAASGVDVFCKQPIPVQALPMRTKDNAVCNIQYMDIEMGMNGNVVNTVYEDKKGIMWIGSKTAGLSKYDGKSFLHYTPKDGFLSTTVNAIIEDTIGNIWIGCNDGVYKYNGKTFTKYTEKEGLSNNSVLCILESKTGEIWFGTSKGVSKYDGESFTSYTEKEGFSNNAIYCIIEDKKSSIWFGTYNDGVIKHNGKKFEHYTKKEGLSGNTISSLLEDKKGMIWLCTESGLCKFDDRSFTNYPFSYAWVNSSVADKSGNIWLATKDNGLVKFDNSTFTQYTDKEGLSSNSLNKIIEDNAGSFWLATDDGINRFVSNSFTHFEEKEIFDSGEMPMAEDKSGGIWIGTKGEKTVYFDGKSFVVYNKLFTNSNKYAVSTLSIYKDKLNNIWFGTNGGGIFKYDGSSFVNYTTKEGLPDNNVYAITSDNQGSIWIGTNAGACKFDGTSFTNYSEKAGLAGNKVFSILEAKDKNLWIATNNGLSRLDNKTKSVINYTTNQGLICNKVHSIIEDKAGSIWVATDSGVSNYHPEFDNIEGSNPFTNYTEKEKLSSNTINSILEDNAGNIWIATNKGLDLITKYELENNQGIPYIISFSKKDGLKNNEFNRNSALIDMKGRAWWGSSSTLIMLDLKNFNIPNGIPNVQLTNIDLNQNFIDYFLLKDQLSKGDKAKSGVADTSIKNLKDISFTDVISFYNYPLNLRLPYNLNYLTFHYSATDWAAPHRIMYQYMLQGLDKDWSPPTESNSADYRDIHPGRYTFKVKSIGVANKWSEPIEYSFVIAEPWWASWWVRGLGVCGGVIIIWLIFNWRTASLRNRQKELEAIVLERTADVVAEKKEVEKQKEVVEQKNKEITDSIEYALRIQSAILPANRIVKQYLDESFILYKPKDIVAGDFYWMETIHSKDTFTTTVLLAACDCTGHGVPGAMVSVVCHNALNRAVREFDLTNPAAILDKTAEIVIESFSKSEEEIKDGMDISLASISFQAKSKTVEVDWAGANNPLWILQKGELIETKADKQPIGKYENNKPFTNHHFTLNTGDSIYLFTDGFADQFGGETGGKKLTRKRFKDLILSVQSKSMKEQNAVLDAFITNYRKELEQVDDILVMGVKV